MTARLYLDEDVIPDLVRLLRKSGHDVVSAHETDTLGLLDEEQLERAASDQRALLSFNYRDFLQLGQEWFVAGRTHWGIIVSYRQYQRQELNALATVVSALLEQPTSDDLKDSVRVLDDFH